MDMQEDWDDYRLFAELAHRGTVRGAAAVLGTSHSTLSRRLSAMEARLGAQLFERGTHGFRLTEAGETLLASVERAGEALDEGRRRLTGIDERMAGPIRVTLPDLLLVNLLLSAIEAFREAHPAVEIELDVSYDAFDLNRREADVAIRMVHLGTSPPPSLVGRKVATSYATGYGHPDYLATHDVTKPDGGAAWLGWAVNDDGAWREKTSHPHLPLCYRINHAEMQRHAAREGLGLAYLPCIIGDTDPDLVRLPDAEPKPARDVWVLTHADLRETARMRAFRDAMTDALRKGRHRLEGA